MQHFSHCGHGNAVCSLECWNIKCQQCDINVYSLCYASQLYAVHYISNILFFFVPKCVHNFSFQFKLIIVYLW
jgi:hypothetical protein